MLRLIRKGLTDQTHTNRNRGNDVRFVELFEAFCVVCGELHYVEESTFLKIHEAVRKSGENPFFCQSCELEYDLRPEC